eukprot:GHRQ01027171.1.p1 GENE.GHRQ01027171.1~~GHRQ01027171.1.p1  ORF type:complete len:153 (+),score=31.38 GHRQ01027171.1:573-1031(+)
MASNRPVNAQQIEVVPHRDAEQIHGLHQRHGALEVEGHSSSSPGTSGPDVEAAISSNADGGKDAGPEAQAAEQQLAQQYADVSYADIAKQFSILGWTGFGGPAAHIGMFQRVGRSCICASAAHRPQIDNTRSCSRPGLEAVGFSSRRRFKGT